MKKWVNAIFKRYFRYRMRQLDQMIRQPQSTQRQVLTQLLEAAAHTEFGKKYDFRSIQDPRDFAARIPVQDYESLKPYIQRMMHGEKDILWGGKTRWFSKSSGTTSDKSKFIPVSLENLRDCHIKGTWDTMAFFYDQRPDARQFECKSLLMGGSLEPFSEYPQTKRGDVSAVMIRNMPMVARPFFTPDLETALLSNFDEKIERMAQIASQDPEVVMIGGVPTWTVVLFRRILELTGKEHMLQVWPQLQGYIHGGVSFTPYREQFRQFLPSPAISYQEIYNASEGYFAAQNQFSEQGMLLLLDNGVYFEFLPAEEWDREFPRSLTLDEVETGRDYALVISTSAGLWRYKIGDTVAFTSTDPYKIKVTGRTQHFINAFGEEVMVDNTDRAIAQTCAELDTLVTEYTVAPVYFQDGGKGGHQWLIEFERPPADLSLFVDRLDANLQKINSDYEAKRYKNMALKRLTVQAVPAGTFHRWLRSKGKYGGQHKVPRLANHRQYVEDLLRFLEERV